MNISLEDEKRLALKMAIGFLRAYCRDRFMNETLDCPNQWRDYCLTANTIASALNREVRQQKLAEERVAKRSRMTQCAPSCLCTRATT